MPTIPLWCGLHSAASSTAIGDGAEGGSGDLSSRRDRLRTGSVEAGSSDSDHDDEHQARASRSSVVSTSPVLAPASSPQVGLSSPSAVWGKYDVDVAELEAQFRREFAASVSSATPSSALPSSAMLPLHPPSRWLLQQGQCTGVLKLIIEACLNRYVYAPRLR
jgi:hypothetical protein